MRNIIAIAGREIRAAFVTPLAYVVITGFLLVSGFFFIALLSGFNSVLQQAAMIPDMETSLNEWVIVPFYQTVQVVLVFLVPMLTMRVIAEEKRSGSFELLITSPVKESEVVLGKFFGASVVVLCMLAVSAVFPLSLIVSANPETAPIWVGFFGVALFALSLVALGVAISAFSGSQTIAGVVSLVVFLLLFVLDAPAQYVGDSLGAVLTYMAPTTHLELLSKGVIDGGDLVYFSSVMLLGLSLANRALGARRWR